MHQINLGIGIFCGFIAILMAVRLGRNENINSWTAAAFFVNALAAAINISDLVVH